MADPFQPIIRGSEWLGAEIIAKDTGLVVGKTARFLADYVLGKVHALLLDGPKDELRVVRIEAIIDSGRSRLLVSTASQITPIGHWPDLEELLGQQPHLGYVGVRDQQGRQLGRIVDVYFQKANGCIIGYGISQGTLDDFPELLFLPANDLTRLNKEALVYNRAKNLASWAKTENSSSPSQQREPVENTATHLPHRLQKGLLRVLRNHTVWRFLAGIVYVGLVVINPWWLSIAIALLIWQYRRLYLQNHTLRAEIEQLDSLEGSYKFQINRLWAHIHELTTDPEPEFGKETGRARFKETSSRLSNPPLSD